MPTSTLLRIAPSAAKVIPDAFPRRLRMPPTLLVNLLRRVSPKSPTTDVPHRVATSVDDVRGDHGDMARKLRRVTLQLEQALRENAAGRRRHAQLVRAVLLAQASAKASARRADCDRLTRLPNRAALDGVLPSMLHDAVCGGKSLLLLFIDLDGFKAVNDRHGHLAGDRVLARLARRLRSCLREGDAAFRLGGDEFVVLMASCDNQLAVRASIGTACCPGDATVADSLLHIADKSMYQDKARRRS